MKSSCKFKIKEIKIIKKLFFLLGNLFISNCTKNLFINPKLNKYIKCEGLSLREIKLIEGLLNSAHELDTTSLNSKKASFKIFEVNPNNLGPFIIEDKNFSFDKTRNKVINLTKEKLNNLDSLNKEEALKLLESIKNTKQVVNLNEWNRLLKLVLGYEKYINIRHEETKFYLRNQKIEEFLISKYLKTTLIFNILKILLFTLFLTYLFFFHSNISGLIFLQYSDWLIMGKFIFGSNIDNRCISFLISRGIIFFAPEIIEIIKFSILFYLLLIISKLRSKEFYDYYKKLIFYFNDILIKTILERK